MIGASYVALECAGFIAGLGYDTSCMVRSIFLRGFDQVWLNYISTHIYCVQLQQMADMAGAYMVEHGVKFFKKFIPTKVPI